MRIYSATGLAKGTARGLRGPQGMPGIPADEPEEPEMGPPGPRGRSGTAGSSVAGSDTEVQFNDGGVLGSDPTFTFNKASNTLTYAGDVHSPGLIDLGAPIQWSIFPSIGGSNTVTWDDFYYTFTGFEITMRLTTSSDGYSAGFGLKDDLDVSCGFLAVTSTGTTVNPAFSNVSNGQAVIIGTEHAKPLFIGCNGIGSFGFDPTTGNVTYWTVPCERSKETVTPATGATVTLAKHQTIIKPAGTLATLTVEMPASPMDGQEHLFVFSQIITALTTSGNGNSIVGAPSAAAVGSKFGFFFEDADNTWYPR